MRYRIETPDCIVIIELGQLNVLVSVLLEPRQRLCNEGKQFFSRVVLTSARPTLTARQPLFECTYKASTCHKVQGNQRFLFRLIIGHVPKIV